MCVSLLISSFGYGLQLGRANVKIVMTTYRSCGKEMILRVYVTAEGKLYI